VNLLVGDDDAGLGGEGHGGEKAARGRIPTLGA
jgi:hypothetical protein